MQNVVILNIGLGRDFAAGIYLSEVQYSYLFTQGREEESLEGQQFTKLVENTNIP
jgi:hypothetical protein